MPMSLPNPNATVWFDGRFVRLSEANVSVLTHALNYGTGVFEGIRGYFEPASGNLHLLRAAEHFERWKKNCGILRIAVPHSPEELTEFTAELCRRNGFRQDVYVRPLAYKSAARLGVAPDAHDSFSIVALPASNYYSPAGIRAAVSSWQRVDDNAVPGRAKICGAYVNSVLAGDEARRNGHDEAIFLTAGGHVAEGASSNIFIVRNGKLITPPSTDNILEGITRAGVMELAERELGLPVVERSVGRTELYVCDEVFLSGTAAEITPVVEIDHRPVGDGRIGPVTARLQSLYRNAALGSLSGYRHWLHSVYSRNTEKAA